MAAEIAMASVNCGATNVTCAQAKELLDDYFARVEQAIPWTGGPDPSTITVRSLTARTKEYVKTASSSCRCWQRDWRLTERSPDEAR